MFMFVAFCITAMCKTQESMNKVHFYVARDENGELFLYMGKPFRGINTFHPYQNGNELQNLRASLLDKANYDVNEAIKCYNFIIGENSCKTQRVNSINSKNYTDGVYICYNDGHNELYDRNNPKNDVRGIGLVIGSHSLCVSLEDIDKTTLTNRNGEPDYDKYISDCDLARMDYDGAGNTKHIQKIGTDIKLADGEYIPSLGEFYLIYLYKYKINEALSYVYGKQIVDGWYWSSTEYSAMNAWFLYFHYGHQLLCAKSTYQYRVRPVSAFIA